MSASNNALLNQLHSSVLSNSIEIVKYVLASPTLAMDSSPNLIDLLVLGLKGRRVAILLAADDRIVGKMSPKQLFAFYCKFITFDSDVGNFSSTITMLKSLDQRKHLGDETTYTMFMHSVSSGHVELTKYFVQRKGLPEPADFFNRMDVNKASPLAVAVSSGNIESLKYLLSIGFSLVPDRTSMYAFIHYAIRNVRMLEFFVRDLGVSVNQSESKESLAHVCTALRTPLHVTTALRFLIDEGCDVNARSAEWKGSRTPLHHAAERQSTAAIIQQLLDAGADPMQKDSDGKMPYEIMSSTRAFARDVLASEMVDANQLSDSFGWSVDSD